jgi:hypothetical protein
MLKCSVRPLIVLVLALVATGVLSTLCSARELKSPVGSQVAHVAGAKPGPIATSGEPDQPLSPPPVRLSNGITALPPDDPEQEWTDWLRWWTSRVWASWMARAAL